jgi:hypothetical protein
MSKEQLEKNQKLINGQSVDEFDIESLERLFNEDETVSIECESEEDDYLNNKLKLVINYDLNSGINIGLNYELERELEQVLKNYGYGFYGSGSGFGVRDLEYIKE